MRGVMETMMRSKNSFLKSRIVELKFFGGLTMDEIAEVEQLSKRTAEREWRKAKAWLYHAIND